MFRSATFKLTMWYLVIVMGISIGFSFVLYQVTTDELARGIHRETQRIYNQFPVFNDMPVLKPSEDLQNSTQHILLRLVTFNAIVFVGAGAASYWLAKRTLEPIEAAHIQQKRFTADVSHELRTPLTALRMETEVALMQKNTSSKELRDTLTSNLEEVDKLEALINNLLRLSQLEADELQQNFTAVPLQTILDDAVQSLESHANEHKVTLSSPTTHEVVYGDAASLTQLFIILLDNAIKYSPTKSEVVLSVAKQGNSAVVSVKDSGVGIPKEELDHVFDRFYRADTSRAKNQHGGYGLGLSIAQMIANVHNADITLKSRVNHGTVATVQLALVDKPTPKIAE